MAISFSQIPGNQLVPLFYAEVTSANEPSAQTMRMCLIGHCNKGAGYKEGTALNNVLYPITRSEAIELFGKGSMLSYMYDKARKNAPAAEIWAIAIPEATTGTPLRSIGTITLRVPAGFTAIDTPDPSTVPGTPRLAGIAKWYIAGRAVQIACKVGDTPTVMASSLVLAVNRMQLPVHASNFTLTVAGPVVTLTCRWAGVTGNEIALTFAGPRGRQESSSQQSKLAKIVSTIVAMSGGAGESETANTFAAIGDTQFDIFVFPFTSLSTLDACQQFMNETEGRWSPFKQLYGHFVTSYIDTYAHQITKGDSRDDPHMTILGIMQSVMPSWEWSSALAGVMMTHWANPPELSRPLQTLQLDGMYVGSEDEASFDSLERQAMLESGISTFTVDRDSSVRIERVRTTRKRNVYGDPDPSWADAITMFQAQFFVRAMRTAITNAFPRAALVDDDSLGINGFCSPALIRQVIVHEYQRLQNLGLVENIGLFRQFLVVERDAVDRGRVNVLCRPDLVNQLRIVAVLVETHLELDPSDPTLQVSNVSDDDLVP